MKKLLFLILLILFPFTLYAGKKIDVDYLAPVSLYKDNYIIFGDMDDQVKLQLSFQYSIFQKYDTGVFIGYSQYSMWSLYNSSSPFFDINYSPELFFKTKYFLKKYLDYIQVSPYQHMSNGRDREESRSLDRFYIEVQSSVNFPMLNTGANLKLFGYYNQGKVNYGRRTCLYEMRIWGALGKKKLSRNEIHFTFSGFKDGFHQIDIISKKIGFLNSRIYLQYRNGYMETMLTHEKRDVSVRIGMLFK
jgi:outer membrane phospholipase A